MSWTLGCTTRPFAGLDLPAACRRISAAGYTDVALFRNAGVEADSDTAQVHKARQITRDAGLVPSMLLAHVDLRLDREQALSHYMRLIDHAALLGASWILDLGAGDRARLDDYVTVIRQAARHAEQAGIQVVVKPHGGITTTSADLLHVHGLVDHPAFGICYDPGNIIYYTSGAERPLDHIADVAPLVRAFIVKDCALDDGKPDVAITPGEGLVDFPAVLQALIQAGFDGPLYLECVGGDSPDEIEENACSR